MKLSPEIELVWSIAGQEAIHAHQEKIAPEQFLCAFLKYAELSNDELEMLAVDQDVAGQLIAARKEVKQTFEDQGWPTRKLRHSLRRVVGRGDFEHEGDVVHRSSEAKECFNKAIQEAGSKLTGQILLDVLIEHPTDKLERALEKVSPGKTAAETDGPGQSEAGDVLDEFTVALFDDQEAPEVQESSQPQVHVTREALAKANQESLLLICEPGAAFQPVLGKAFDEGDFPFVIRRLKAGKLVDQAQTESLVVQELLLQLFDAVEEKGDVLLIDFSEAFPADGEGFVGELEFAVTDRLEPVPLILALTKTTYQELFSGKDAFTRGFRTIWFHSLTDLEVPSVI